MSNAHTYDKWQELGFQVKRGEKASYRLYGKYIFRRNQVVRSEKEYQNHCFRCSQEVSSYHEEQCDDCNWFICSDCGACGCDYND